MKDVLRKLRIPGPTFRKILFLVLFFLPMLLTFLIVFTGQRDVSVRENRTLTKLPVFSADAFGESTFQDDLEKALIDQWPLAEEVKGAALDGKNALMQFQQRILYALKPDLKTAYSMIAEGYYHYREDEHRIVEKPKDLSKEQAHLESLAENVNAADADVYVYFIENSRAVDFDQPDPGHPVYHRILEAIAPAAADLFAVPDYDAYCRDFYQTDHHWTIDGAYKGYQAIYRLLHGTEEGMIGPGELIRTDAVFQGAYARQTHILCADETFSLRVFDLPSFSTQINGRRKAYGNQKMYQSGRYSRDELTNHYANCFGGDHGEIVYDFGTEGKGNLLIVASSYSNPINALIAAGYDRTFVIDLRYYEAYANHPFDTAEYCRENDIHKILLLGDVNLFYVDGPESGVE